MLTVVQPLENTMKLRIPIANHDGLGVIENAVYAVDHEAGNVRYAIEYEVPIGTNQAG